MADLHDFDPDVDECDCGAPARDIGDDDCFCCLYADGCGYECRPCRQGKRITELEAGIRAKDLELAEALALIMSHEGRIAELEATVADLVEYIDRDPDGACIGVVADVLRKAARDG